MCEKIHIFLLLFLCGGPQYCLVVNIPRQHIAASSGSGKADLEKLCAILEAIPAIKYICLDVANGYSEHFVEFVKNVREKFPKHTIMVKDSSRFQLACTMYIIGLSPLISLEFR